MNNDYSGIIPPLVTPLRGRDELDAPGLEKLLDRIVDGGVSGLFVLGTTGEGPSLSYRLRRELVERVCAFVDKQIPVLVGITDTAFVETLNMAKHAADSGADALVLAPPYYLPGGQAELLEYLDHLVPELPLPLFLYNMPALTKVSFEPATVRCAMDNEKIIGIKDSSGDLKYYRELCALAPQRSDWKVLMGPEELLVESVLMGGHGGVNGGANVFPRLYVALYEAARKREEKRMKELQEAVMQIGRTLYRVGNHPSSIIKGIKCALSCEGVCDDFMAEPFHRFRAAERNRVQQHLEEIGAELKRLKV